MAAVAPAADPPRAESSGESTRVVLLRNDHCLTGLVRQLGDQVVVEISPDARVSKAAKEVEFIADDLEGIYQHKLSRYTRLGPGENMRLARWCLSVGMNEHASRHFLAVHKEAGSNPLVKQLGVELREQLLKDEAFRDYLGLAPLDSPGVGADSVQMASTTATDQATPLLPMVAATFTDHVQPILLNRCSQSGCHGLSASNRLKIIQPIGTARARISEQNCRSALQFIDVDDSGLSALLSYAMTKHGIQRQPSITTQEGELIKVLQSWTTFARAPVAAAVGSSSGQPGGAMQAIYTGRSPASPTQPASTNGFIIGAGSFGVAPLLPVDPRSPHLHTVPRQPKFGVQPSLATALPAGTGTPSVSELDMLDDQVRRALGEPPRSVAGVPATPAPLASNSASPVNGGQPSVIFPSPGATAAPAAPVGSASMPADPFDPAEFNRRAAAKSQP